MTEVKKKIPEGLLYDNEGFRMSTPPEIASYIAERVGGGVIADMGCGIGVQTIYFARRSERVIAVDMDPGRLEICRKNCEKMQIENVDFVLGDALSEKVIGRVREAEVIHSDPSRLKGGKWTMDLLSPNPLKVSRAYGGDMCFDLPALMPVEEIPQEWEREFISLGGELKRMCTYTGTLKRYERSAVSLPGGGRVVYDPKVDRKIWTEERPSRFIYDIDSSISVSGLLPEFLSLYGDMRVIQQDRQRTLATSQAVIRDQFITRSYEILVKAGNLADLKKRIKEIGAGKIYLRFSIDPALYYSVKNSLEEGLDGDTPVFIFKFQDLFYAAIRI